MIYWVQQSTIFENNKLNHNMIIQNRFTQKNMVIKNIFDKYSKVFIYYRFSPKIIYSELRRQLRRQKPGFMNRNLIVFILKQIQITKKYNNI